MDVKTTETGVVLDFEDPTEAFFLMKAIFSFKHGEAARHHYLSDVSLRNEGIYKLALAVQEYFQNNEDDVERYNFKKMFVLTSSSQAYQQIMDNLKHQCQFVSVLDRFERDNSEGACLWLKCYFAPCLIDDELALMIANELGMFK